MVAEMKETGSFGHADPFKKIIVDPSGNVLDGHHRVLAAQIAGVAIPESAIYRTSVAATKPVVSWETIRATLGR